MSKKWYPIINYETCSECGACFNKCTHGVYTKEGNKNIVTSPDNCVEGCRGCQSLCKTNSIEYAGDTSTNKNATPGCGCGCSCGSC